MDVERIAELGFAYLATYALHSTLLAGLALWGARRVAARAPLAAERLLRAALLGGVVTAAVPFALGIEPLGGRLELAARAPVAQAPVLPAPVAALAPPSCAPSRAPADGPTKEDLVLASEVPAALGGTIDASPFAQMPWAEPASFVDGPAEPAAAAPAASGAGWPDLAQALIALWLAAVLGGLVLVGRDLGALRRALRWRVELRAGPLRRALDELCAAAGTRRRVRLSIAPCTHVPLSFGLARPEIALPPRTLEELGPDEQRAVLAHELAHLVRRDIAWLWIGRALALVFCFQPLNRLILRELERRAEFAADRWARGRLGSGAPLASALAEIAGWLIETPRSLPAAPMARERSQLVRRVEVLLAGDGAAEARAWSATAPLACAVVAAWAPVVSSSPPSEPAPLAPAGAAGAPASPGVAATEVAAADFASAELASAAAPRPAATAAPDPVAELDDRLGRAATPREVFEVTAAALDLEIEALESEVLDLERELAAGEPEVAIQLELASLRSRVDRLVERRGRLRDLFLAFTRELDAASAASPEDTARHATLLEESR